MRLSRTVLGPVALLLALILAVLLNLILRDDRTNSDLPEEARDPRLQAEPEPLELSSLVIHTSPQPSGGRMTVWMDLAIQWTCGAQAQTTSALQLWRPLR